MPTQQPVPNSTSASLAFHSNQAAIVEGNQEQTSGISGDELFTNSSIDTIKLTATQPESGGVNVQANIQQVNFSIIQNTQDDKSSATNESSSSSVNIATNGVINQQQQQVNNKTTATTNKTNGLKNRILQRPPPLILDKVSNFYDNETQSSITNVQQHHHHHQQAKQVQPQPEERTQQQNEINQNHANNNNNSNGGGSNNNNNNNNGSCLSSSNDKFWASLNQNASASRAKIQPAPPASSAAAVPSNWQDSDNPSAAGVKDSVGSANGLGADLIITHRNNNTKTAVATISKTASSSIHKQQQQKLQVSSEIVSDERKQTLATNHNNNNNNNNNVTEPVVAENENTPTKPHDMSNNSEFDDFSTHVASENDGGGGGNLIGVDNPTPPASTELNLDIHCHDEPPTSATSSRPRSNNPFLSTDEELSLADHNGTNSFHSQRPASFIAATGGGAIMGQQETVFQQQVAADSSSQQQLQIQEQFNSMHFNEHQRPHQLMHMMPQQDNPYCSKTILVDQQQQQPYDHGDGSYKQQIRAHCQLLQQSIYGNYSQNGNNYNNYESIISMDSANSNYKQPKNTIMQSPHWTEAIYELDNAILDTKSVAGGAETGEFIYIVDKGDIILELDQVKVSGYTLNEFNKLLQVKSIHLLKVIQTKQCRGITTNLKQYLNCTFPRNSLDRKLQDLIRGNIYRRTIPCTTRPPKKGEVDKVDYHFLSKEQFVEINNRGMLLECGMFGGHYYGTMRPYSDLSNLSVYGSVNQEVLEEMRQPLNANHPAIGLTAALKKRAPQPPPNIQNFVNTSENLYENHESLKMLQAHHASIPLTTIETTMASPRPWSINQEVLSDNSDIINTSKQQSSIVAVDSEALPVGWERVIDRTHGTYFIDHNTQRTQYERPHEVELTKGTMGFGFTLVEADNGVLLVRSIIPGSPAHLNGMIRPGDVLISAVGVPVANLQHTDVARLFSTFACGDRVKLTFARSTYVVDANLVPDEYLFSNGTNGKMELAINPSKNYNYFNQNIAPQSPHILVNQELEYITVTMKRGDQGFGFTISDSVAGQKVKDIQRNEVLTNLKQGDILVGLNGQDLTKLTHKEVVERLKDCPAGQYVTLVVKRKKRFRSITPMPVHTENAEYSLNNTHKRNCKTPSVDGLMLMRSNLDNTSESFLTPLFGQPPVGSSQIIESNYFSPENYRSLPDYRPIDSQSIYNSNPMANSELYNGQQVQHMSLPIHLSTDRPGYEPPLSGNLGLDNMTNSVHPSEASLPPIEFANLSGQSQLNQFNNFMNNDKLVMMQMQQPKSQLNITQPISVQNIDYNHMPLYSNSDILRGETSITVPLPPKSINQQIPEIDNNSANFQNNFYANNEEIALQRVQCGGFEEVMLPMDNHQAAPPLNDPANIGVQSQTELQEEDEYEYHHVDIDRGNTDSTWGIRLIGGSEVGRAISIGSVVFGGAASKNGGLKSGDEIISINDINVVGATHHHVVELISACSTRASLVVRRKKFAEACNVILTRNLDEGFGFVIISSGDCTLIGIIIEGSPAHRCQQLHVRDRIIAVNGHYITPETQHPEIVNLIKESGSTLRLRIIPANSYTVELIKNPQTESFGFSMRGGSEFDGAPLYILKVAENGLARDLLNVGDQIMEINNIPTVGMTHQQAATIIKCSETIVKLKLRRNYLEPSSFRAYSPRALQKLC